MGRGGRMQRGGVGRERVPVLYLPRSIRRRADEFYGFFMRKED